MKRVCSILLAGMALVAVASCGNRGKKVQIVMPEEEVVAKVAKETSTETKMYANSYDGYTNVRQSPSSKAPVLGKLRNGNEFVVVIGEVDNWLEVEYYDKIGYVHRDYVSETPSKPVTVNVDANWLNGCWTSYGYVYYLVFSNGKFALVHQYGEMGFGKWHLEGNDIVFVLKYVNEYGREMDCTNGQKERFTINRVAGKMGDMEKWDTPAQLGEGEDGITKSYFNALKKDANKYVRK